MSVPTLIRTSLVLIKFTLMSRSARAANIRVATPVWVRIPTPTTDSLAKVGSTETSLTPALPHGKRGALGRFARHGERQQGIPVRTDVLHDHIHEHTGFGDRAEDPRRVSRPVGHVEQGGPGPVTRRVPPRRSPGLPLPCGRGSVAGESWSKSPSASGTNFIARLGDCDGLKTAEAAVVPRLS